MDIEQGWTFHSADFSLQAAGSSDIGNVVLVRTPFNRIREWEWIFRWYRMPDELKEDDTGPELYVHGSGRTVEEAVINANLAAAHAKPIPDTDE